jgi:hypothetical protein
MPLYLSRVYLSRARKSITLMALAMTSGEQPDRQTNKCRNGLGVHPAKVSQQSHSADHGISLALQVSGAAGPGVASASNGRALQCLQQLVLARMP